MAWPTTTDPKTEFVTIRLTVDEAAQLDAAALLQGERRSEYVRTAIEERISRAAAAAKKAVTKRGKGKP